MRTYENKDELKNEINKSFAKYISEFDIIPESLKDKRVEEVDRTPAENLAYQVGWTTLVLKWCCKIMRKNIEINQIKPCIIFL